MDPPPWLKHEDVVSVHISNVDIPSDNRFGRCVLVLIALQRIDCHHFEDGPSAEVSQTESIPFAWNGSVAEPQHNKLITSIRPKHSTKFFVRKHSCPTMIDTIIYIPTFLEITYALDQVWPGGAHCMIHALKPSLEVARHSVLARNSFHIMESCQLIMQSASVSRFILSWSLLTLRSSFGGLEKTLLFPSHPERNLQQRNLSIPMIPYPIRLVITAF